MASYLRQSEHADCNAQCADCETQCADCNAQCADCNAQCADCNAQRREARSGNEQDPPYNTTFTLQHENVKALVLWKVLHRWLFWKVLEGL